eukprot:gene9444-8901_t
MARGPLPLVMANHVPGENLRPCDPLLKTTGAAVSATAHPFLKCACLQATPPALAPAYISTHPGSTELLKTTLRTQAVLKQQSLYSILQVPATANMEEIKAAFRVAAKKHHPDVASSSGSSEYFKEVINAYEVLSDQTRRTAYDARYKLMKELGDPGDEEEDRLARAAGERVDEEGLGDPGDDEEDRLAREAVERVDEAVWRELGDPGDEEEDRLAREAVERAEEAMKKAEEVRSMAKNARKKAE